MQINSSQILALYRKLLYSKNIAPINIKFTKSNTLYDREIINIENQYLNFIPYSLSDSCIDSPILFINDPAELINKDQHFNSIIANKVIFFHDDKILKMKKEDLFLFKQQVSKYIKFTFDNRICSIIEAIPISYGFKTSIKADQSRDKSIIFLGNQQNIDLVAYNHIKGIYKDADFINIENINNIDINNILANYKICISMNSIYNNLLAAANGCFVISSIGSQDIPHYSLVNSFEGIIDSISNIMQNYNREAHLQISKTITEKYNYSIFINNLNTIVKETCNRVTIL